jgi:hypothetical protein
MLSISLPKILIDRKRIFKGMIIGTASCGSNKTVFREIMACDFSVDETV